LFASIALDSPPVASSGISRSYFFWAPVLCDRYGDGSSLVNRHASFQAA